MEWCGRVGEITCPYYTAIFNTTFSEWILRRRCAVAIVLARSHSSGHQSPDRDSKGEGQ
jgi:hypothetical protein